MGKYRIVKSVTSAKGGKFVKDEIVNGTPNPTLKGYIVVDRKNDYDNKNNLVEDFEIVKVAETTPLTNQTQLEILTTNEIKSDRNLTALSYLGAIIGVYIAYKKKKKVGGYIGYMILGGIAGSLTAHLVNRSQTKK